MEESQTQWQEDWISQACLSHSYDNILWKHYCIALFVVEDWRDNK